VLHIGEATVSPFYLSRGIYCLRPDQADRPALFQCHPAFVVDYRLTWVPKGPPVMRACLSIESYITLQNMQSDGHSAAIQYVQIGHHQTLHDQDPLIIYHASHRSTNESGLAFRMQYLRPSLYTSSATPEQKSTKTGRAQAGVQAHLINVEGPAWLATAHT
jgi:hypothetical protein